MARYLTAEAKQRHVEEQRAYELRHPERVAAATSKWRRANGISKKRKRLARENNPEKYRARKMLADQIRNGAIVRPEHCENCKRECRPQAHHYDYRKPFAVKWLCRPCHLALDGKQARVWREGDPQ